MCQPPIAKAAHFWKLLSDPVEILETLICRNRLHFGQAQGTFPTIPPFHEAVDWAASTTTADETLAGYLPIDDMALDDTATFVFTNSTCRTPLGFTAKEWGGNMQAWRESSSPGGMHLGHKITKRVLVPDDSPPPGVMTIAFQRKHLVQGQLDLWSYAIKRSYCQSGKLALVELFILRFDGHDDWRRAAVSRQGLGTLFVALNGGQCACHLDWLWSIHAKSSSFLQISLSLTSEVMELRAVDTLSW
jgi:hypothetical protein